MKKMFAVIIASLVFVANSQAFVGFQTTNHPAFKSYISNYVNLSATEKDQISPSFMFILNERINEQEAINRMPAAGASWKPSVKLKLFQALVSLEKFVYDCLNWVEYNPIWAFVLCITALSFLILAAARVAEECRYHHYRAV